MMARSGRVPADSATSASGAGEGTGIEHRERRRQARATLPALMQDVQAFTRLGVPFWTVRTDWMFGFQRRLVRRCEWEMLCPKPGPDRKSVV